MPGTRLQLRFRIWGKALDPEALTASLGVEPTKSFHVGERRWALKDLAGWEWWSDWVDSDIAPLTSRLLDLFQNQRETIQQQVSKGATVGLSVVGDIDAYYVDSREEASKRNYDISEEPFRPFLDSDRVGLELSAEFLGFLASVSATVDTHIDIDLFGGFDTPGDSK
jgi:hypothetical protein